MSTFNRYYKRECEKKKVILMNEIDLHVRNCGMSKDVLSLIVDYVLSERPRNIKYLDINQSLGRRINFWVQKESFTNIFGDKITDLKFCSIQGILMGRKNGYTRISEMTISPKRKQNWGWYSIYDENILGWLPCDDLLK